MMTDEKKDDGSTPDTSKNLAECMGRYAHKWQWVWQGSNNWTNRQRCTTCGEEREVLGG